MSWVAVGVAAAAAIIKTEAIDAPKEARQRKLAAATQRYSPWTGLNAGPIQEADLGGNMLQFGMTGAAMHQGMQDHDQQMKLTDSEIAKNNATANTLPGKATAPQTQTQMEPTSMNTLPASQNNLNRNQLYADNGLKNGRSGGYNLWNYYSV